MNGYVAAHTLDEVLQELSADATALPVAGGTDLVVGARQGKYRLPESLVGIHAVEELAGIGIDQTGLTLGALAVHAEVVNHRVIAEQYSGLADASALVGSPATRHTGTIGGNVMNASPAMDTGAPLLVHGAEAELRSVRGSRTVSIGELWTGPGGTCAAPDELLTSVHVPAPARGAGSAYVRLGYRRAMEIAVVGAAVMVVVDDGGEVIQARVAMTALAPTIRRIPAAEEILNGQSLTEDAIACAAAAVAEAAQPIDDVRASARYRLAMAAVVTRRAIGRALSRARHTNDLPPAVSMHDFGGQL